MAPTSRPAVYLSRNPHCSAGIRDLSSNPPRARIRLDGRAWEGRSRRRWPRLTSWRWAARGAGCHETLLEEGYVTRRGGAPTAAGRQARTAGRAQRGRGPHAATRAAAVGRAAPLRAAPTNGPATVPVRDRRLTHLRANGKRARWRSRGPAARRLSSIAAAPCTSCRRVRSRDRRGTAPTLLRHLLGSRAGAHRRSGWGMDRGPVQGRSGHTRGVTGSAATRPCRTLKAAAHPTQEQTSGRSAPLTEMGGEADIGVAPTEHRLLWAGPLADRIPRAAPSASSPQREVGRLPAGQPMRLRPAAKRRQLAT